MCPITKMGESCLFHCETRLQAGVLFVCPHLTTTAQNDPHQPLLQNYIKQQKRFQTTEIQSGVPLSPIKQEATEALLKLFTNTTIKFTDIDQQDFKSFCWKLIEIGQRKPTEHIQNLLPEMERHCLPDMLCQKAVHTLREFDLSIRKLPQVWKRLGSGEQSRERSPIIPSGSKKVPS